jgi:hypothetical protein
VKRRVIMFPLLPLLTFAIVAVAVLRPFSANATAPRAHKPHPFAASEHIKRPGNNVIYHGGPVMGGTANVYAIFWEPTGSYISPGYNSLILQYFNDIGGSSLYHNDTQYKDSSNSFPSNAVLAGSWIDAAAYPSGTLSDTQIQAEVTNAQTANHWSSSLSNVFFVFTAKGENICIDSTTCFGSTFCAYHSNFGNTLYAVMPYTGTYLSNCGVPSSPNKDFDADSTINVISHEQNEAATDPLGTAWYDSVGNEIGDKCVWQFGPLNSAGGDVTWNGHSYEVQKEWDNKVKGCVLAGP